MSKYPVKRIDSAVIDWLNAIWLTDLPPNAKYLACYLRKFMNAYHDTAWPSYSRIIEETGLARSTVAKYLKLLETEQWLIREPGNSNKNTVYTACLPRVVEEQVKEFSIKINNAQLNAQGSTSDEPRSTPRELRVVRHTNPNKQSNKQVINNKDISAFENAHENAHSAENEFNRLWTTWPNKKNKKRSQSVFAKIANNSPRPDIFVNNLIADIQARIQSNQLGFTEMMLSTYLNGERWNDDITTRQTRKDPLLEAMGLT